MTNRIIVAGGRDFQNYPLLCRKLDKILSSLSGEIIILSGAARGADKLGERYAAERGHAVERFPADWGTYGRRAGPLRNAQMAIAATHCVVFWDGVSRGTKSMVDIAERAGLPLRVVRY